VPKSWNSPEARPATGAEGTSALTSAAVAAAPAFLSPFSSTALQRRANIVSRTIRANEDAPGHFVNASHGAGRGHAGRPRVSRDLLGFCNKGKLARLSHSCLRLYLCARRVCCFGRATNNTTSGSVDSQTRAHQQSKSTHREADALRRAARRHVLGLKLLDRLAQRHRHNRGHVALRAEHLSDDESDG
jgi:hypothetical protein